MICPYCASYNRESSNYCGECGKPMIQRQGPEILWDLSHGPFVTCDPRVPSSEYSGLAQFVRNSGYAVDLSTAQLDANLLAGKSAVIVMVTTAWQKPYEQKEASLLADFAERGGGVLICAENRAVDENANLEALLTPHGVRAGLSREDSPVYNLEKHPVFDGVDGIRVSDWGKLGSSGSLAAIARDAEENIFAVAGSVGEGRIIVMGDCSLWDNHHLLHNSPLATNLLGWLAQDQQLDLRA
ncbi:MAG: DUF4350 domain-containing protein [Armatimonadetes bacterium]|nr:DUF4350 domain-containing protein [Armatimonadota bacterium]